MISHSIMVLEDDFVINQVIKKYLHKYGYTIYSFENGKTALNFLYNTVESPIVIVSDIMMPEMGGIEFLKILKNHPRFKKIPIIAITAMDENQFEENIKDQFSKILYKPFALKKLKTEIEIIISGIKLQEF